MHGVVGLLGGLAFASMGTYVQAEANFQSIAASLSITTLLSVLPVRIIKSARTVYPPWWSDLLIYLVTGLAMVGVYTEEATMIFVGCFAIMGVNLVCFIALCVVENRKSVRAYTKGRRWVFVSTTSGEII